MTNLNKKNKQPKRKQLYINKAFQTRFMVRFCLVLILGAIISIGLTLFMTQDTLTSSYENSRLVIRNTSLAIMPSVIYTHLATTVVLLILSVVVTLVMSHKIAGPMYRFEKDIDRVANGDLKSKINIRQGDQFQGLANSLNGMITSLNSELGSIKQEIEVLAQDNDLPEEVHGKIVCLNEKIESTFSL